MIVRVDCSGHANLEEQKHTPLADAWSAWLAAAADAGLPLRADLQVIPLPDDEPIQTEDATC